LRKNQDLNTKNKNFSRRIVKKSIKKQHKNRGKNDLKRKWQNRCNADKIKEN
jgi:hypothetical protein